MSIASLGVAAVLVAGGVLGGAPGADAAEQQPGEQLGTSSAGAAGDERLAQLQTCQAGDFQGTGRVVLSRVGDQVATSIEGYRIDARGDRSDSSKANMQLSTEERDQNGQVVATRSGKSKDDLHQDNKWRDLGKPISTGSVAVAGHTYWSKVKFTFDTVGPDPECTTVVRMIKNDEVIGTPVTQTHTGTDSASGRTGIADVGLQRTGDFVTGTLSRYFMIETNGQSYVQLRMEQRDGSTGQVLNRKEKSGELRHAGGWRELAFPLRAEFPAIEGATYHAQVKFTEERAGISPDVKITTEFQDFGTMNHLPPVNLAASSQVVSREGSAILTATVPEDATGTITFVETTSGTDRTLTQVPVVNGTAATTYTASSTARGTRTFIAAYTGDGDTRYQDNRSTPITITIH